MRIPSDAAAFRVDLRHLLAEPRFIQAIGNPQSFGVVGDCEEGVAPGRAAAAIASMEAAPSLQVE